MRLLKELRMCFDWSNNCGNFFRRESVKSRFNYFEEKYFATKTINNIIVHAQIYLAAKWQIISPNRNPPLVVMSSYRNDVGLWNSISLFLAE